MALLGIIAKIQGKLKSIVGDLKVFYSILLLKLGERTTFDHAVAQISWLSVVFGMPVYVK